MFGIKDVRPVKQLLLAVGGSVILLVGARLALPRPTTAAASPALVVDTVACNSLVSAASVITLAGTITRQVDEMPVDNVQVFVFDTTLGDGQSCASDGSGRYTVTMDAAHTYNVTYNPPAGSGLASQARNGIAGAGLITRNVALTTGFTISGATHRLTDSTTIGAVDIFAQNVQTGIGFGLPPSQPGGSYQINLEPGTWDLVFTPPPFQGLGPTQSLSIPLTADLVVDAWLPTGTTIFGQIKSPTGEEVAGAALFALVSNTLANEVQGFGFPVSTASGHYTGTLPLGKFDLQVLPPLDQGLGAVVITDQMPAGLTHELPITLPAGVTISGTTSCETPLEGVFVFADPEPSIPGDDIGGWGQFSDSQGHFGLALVTDTYRLEFKPPEVTGLPKREFMADIQEDRFWIIDFCPIYLPIIRK